MWTKCWLFKKSCNKFMTSKINNWNSHPKICFFIFSQQFYGHQKYIFFGTIKTKENPFFWFFGFVTVYFFYRVWQNRLESFWKWIKSVHMTPRLNLKNVTIFFWNVFNEEDKIELIFGLLDRVWFPLLKISRKWLNHVSIVS